LVQQRQDVERFEACAVDDDATTDEPGQLVS
jgi:hypothetical protein